MDMDVGADGLSELEARLARAHDGVLSLQRDLSAELEHATPPSLVFASPRMRARSWGDGDVWTLPAGGWIAAHDGRVHLPTDLDGLQDHLQRLLD